MRGEINLIYLINLVHLAREAGIPYQVVVKKVGGTNVAALQVEGTGARAAALSVPVRYIHAPVSLLNKSDLEAAIALAARRLPIPIASFDTLT